MEDRTLDPDATLATRQHVGRKASFQDMSEELEAHMKTTIVDSVDDEKDSMNSNGSCARVEKTAGGVSAMKKKKRTGMPLISAMIIPLVKWAKTMKAVNSGNYPDFGFDEGKLVAVANERADSELRLKTLSKDGARDLEDDWVRGRSSVFRIGQVASVGLLI